MKLLVLAATVAMMCATARCHAPEPLDPNMECPYDATFTAADCPNGFCWAVPPNGCGSSSLGAVQSQIVPAQWPAGIDFGSACNVHHMCYFSPGSDKQSCDAEFQEALLDECRTALTCDELVLVGQQCFPDPSRTPQWGACHSLADLMYYAVQARVGQAVFDAAQQAAAAHAQQCRESAAHRQQQSEQKEASGGE